MPDKLLIVREATRPDIAFLVESNAAMAIETEGKALDCDTLMRGVTAVFEQTTRGFYLIAERDGNAVGCLMITHEWSDWRGGDWWWIQSVYVTADARRTGAFRALYADVERRARETTDVIGLRLYVEKQNTAARTTYASLGMIETSYDLLECEFAAQST